MRWSIFAVWLGMVVLLCGVVFGRDAVDCLASVCLCDTLIIFAFMLREKGK
jgi:hypothetical protein